MFSQWEVTYVAKNKSPMCLCPSAEPYIPIADPTIYLVPPGFPEASEACPAPQIVCCNGTLGDDLTRCCEGWDFVGVVKPMNF